MSKRLFDTSMYDDPWFRRLTPINKLFWIYLLSKCDIAGFWKVDFDRASWEIGAEIKLADSSIIFADRITVLDNNDVWFIKKFKASLYITYRFINTTI